MASYQHLGKAFGLEPLPMGGSPGAYHTVPDEMQNLLAPHYVHNRARAKAATARGKAASAAKAKKVKDTGKPSRDELNRREKERMHLLNERIDQIKDMLEDAGVQLKKTKQSVLDNAAFYIERLQGDLAIAQQAAAAMNDAARGSTSTASGSDNIYERCFQQSVMPRVVVDVNLKLLAANAAFTQYTGHGTKYLVKKNHVRKFLTKEKGKLEATLAALREHGRPIAFATTADSFQGDTHVMLSASPVLDANGKLSTIEFSLVPQDTSVNNGNTTAGDTSSDRESVVF